MSPTCNKFTYYKKEHSGRSLTSSKPLFTNLKNLDVFSIYTLSKYVLSCTYIIMIPELFLLLKSFKLEIKFINIQPDTLDFYRPHTWRTNIKKFSILFQGSRIWNSLPNNIINAPTLNIFRRVIKPFLRVRQDAALHIYFSFSKHTYILKCTSFFFIFKCRLVFKLPVGEISLPHKSVGFSEIYPPQSLQAVC